MTEFCKKYIDAVETALEQSLPDAEAPHKRLYDAMRYSLLGGGKRLRPVMLLEFCRICGGDWRDALPFAAAIEMVHVYSLIHDDLPCMDDDDIRRGKPSCHKAFGEPTALLAGSALLSRAFETMLSETGLPLRRVVKAAYIVAAASGAEGIAGGQELDLHRNGVSEREIHRRKTAAMFAAAAEAGSVIAAADSGMCETARQFGVHYGMGFQYADDFMDSDGSPESGEEALLQFRKALSLLERVPNSELLRAMTDERMQNLKGLGC